MALTSRQTIIHAHGKDIKTAKENLAKQLESLPEVRIVSISSYVVGGAANGVGGLLNLVVVAEELSS